MAPAPTTRCDGRHSHRLIRICSGHRFGPFPHLPDVASCPRLPSGANPLPTAKVFLPKSLAIRVRELPYRETSEPQGCLCVRNQSPKRGPQRVQLQHRRRIRRSDPERRHHRRLGGISLYRPPLAADHQPSGVHRADTRAQLTRRQHSPSRSGKRKGGPSTARLPSTTSPLSRPPVIPGAERSSAQRSPPAAPESARQPQPPPPGAGWLRRP